jgi:hypothetical protein
MPQRRYALEWLGHIRISQLSLQRISLKPQRDFLFVRFPLSVEHAYHDAADGTDIACYGVQQISDVVGLAVHLELAGQKAVDFGGLVVTAAHAAPIDCRTMKNGGV